MKLCHCTPRSIGRGAERRGGRRPRAASAARAAVHAGRPVHAAAGPGRGARPAATGAAGRRRGGGPRGGVCKHTTLRRRPPVLPRRRPLRRRKRGPATGREADDDTFAKLWGAARRRERRRPPTGTGEGRCRPGGSGPAQITTPGSDHDAVDDVRVLDDDHDAVLDEVAVVLAVGLTHVLLVDDLDLGGRGARRRGRGDGAGGRTGRQAREAALLPARRGAGVRRPPAGQPPPEEAPTLSPMRTFLSISALRTSALRPTPMGWQPGTKEHSCGRQGRGGGRGRGRGRGGTGVRTRVASRPHACKGPSLPCLLRTHSSPPGPSMSWPTSLVS
jgi:hypothetical protein